MAATYMAKLTKALSDASGLGPMFEAAAEAYQAEIGFRLLTVSSIDEHEHLTATRLWSSSQTIFPIGGTKPLNNTEWLDAIMRERRPLVCNDPHALRRMFHDHADIEAVECGSGINLPIVLKGDVIGVVNVFHEPYWFTVDRVQDATSMLALMYPPMLLRGML
jgi:hypothetical protein